MGRPSDRGRSARRPGRNERQRVKKKQGGGKSSAWHIMPGSVEVSYHELGRKKADRWRKWFYKNYGNPFAAKPA